ncbi:MAG: tetratricopeptide repeat protein [Deltaproteobacteria bacterium]|nr:tetratricopeptide repeat protein [Deltaproteobacteria bacterium]
MNLCQKCLTGLLVFGTLVLLPCLQATGAQAIPEQARRHFNRGLAAVEMARTAEDYELAIAEFRKAEALAPNWPEIHYNLGLIQEKAGRYGEAAQSLRRYLKLAPKAPDAAAVEALADKLEFKAEQALSDDDILEILASLTDSAKWRLRGIRNANLFNQHKWVKSIRREGNALWITSPSGTCGAALLPPSPVHYIQDRVMPNGNSLDFQTLYCLCNPSVQRDHCPETFRYHFEVVSRRKVTMTLNYWRSGIRGGPADSAEASFEFVRN